MEIKITISDTGAGAGAGVGGTASVQVSGESVGSGTALSHQPLLDSRLLRHRKSSAQQPRSGRLTQDQLQAQEVHSPVFHRLSVPGAI